jgi:hypothetical protein
VDVSARQVGPFGFTAFVPNGSGDYSRRDLAIILIGAAREVGLDDAHHVRATSGGFYISDELADVLYDEQDSEPKAARKKSTKQKASGNRAAKRSTAEKE